MEAFPLVADARVVHDRVAGADRALRAVLVERTLDAEGILHVLADARGRIAGVHVRARIVVIAVLPLVLATEGRTAVLRAGILVVARNWRVLAEVVGTGPLVTGTLVAALRVLVAPALGELAPGVFVVIVADLRSLALRLVRALTGLPFAVVVRARIVIVAVRVFRACDTAELGTAMRLSGHADAEAVVRLVLDVAAEFAGIDRASDAVIDELWDRRADVQSRVANGHDARVADLAVRVLDTAAVDLVVRPAARRIADVRGAFLAVRLLDALRLAAARENVAHALVAGVTAHAVADCHAGSAEADVIRAGDAVVAGHWLVDAVLIRVTPVDGAGVVVTAFAIAGALAGVVVATARGGATVLGRGDAVVAGHGCMLAVSAGKTAVLRAGVVVVAGVDVRRVHAAVRRVRGAEVQSARVAIVTASRLVVAAEVFEVLRGLRIGVAVVDGAGIAVVAEVLGLKAGEDRADIALRPGDATRHAALDWGLAVLVRVALVGLAGVRAGAGRADVFVGIRLGARPALIGGGVLRVRRDVVRIRERAEGRVLGARGDEGETHGQGHKIDLLHLVSELHLQVDYQNHDSISFGYLPRLTSYLEGVTFHLLYMEIMEWTVRINVLQ